ncbi:hypothetical protein LTR37_009474 [Vermiconidia calcicola]|uniref:Uncharacterized protein n=1 Tax=Vermiconidia calcicola TaxID=1690605 RepID=A0ACC3NAK2_9PEZI|nr:hypothetical protein LTR37_009474 [Vermiconidia calcicola]
MPTTQQLDFYGLKPGNIVHQGADCHICLEKVSEPVVTSCRHIFCWECLFRWLLEHTSCPTCREDLCAARNRQWDRDAAERLRASQAISRHAIQAFGTIEHGASETPMPPVIASVPRQYASFATLTGLSARRLTESDTRRSAPTSSPMSNALFPQTRHPGRTLSDDVSPVARSSTGSLQDRDLAERQPPSTIHNSVQDRDIGIEPNRTDRPSTVETLKIDARKMVQTMRVRATSLANQNGLRYNPDYMAAAKAVAARWKTALQSRAESTMVVDGVMELLRNEMVEALYDGGFIRRNAVEDIPRALTEYLYQVARAAIGDE